MVNHVYSVFVRLNRKLSAPDSGAKPIAIPVNTLKINARSIVFHDNEKVLSSPSRVRAYLENQVDSRKAPGSVGAMAYRHKNKVLVVYFDRHVGEISQGSMAN